jgi:hypothetical protein
LAYKVNPVTRARARMSKKSVVVADVADKSEVERTWALFVNLFVDVPNDEPPSVPNQSEVARWEDDILDRGVGKFKGMPTDDLCLLLGFLGGRPPSWMDVRATDPLINSWDYPNQFQGIKKGAPLPTDLATLELLWHQLVGIASMVDKAFSEHENDKVPGFILADAVGVGKTAQIMGFIAFLQLVWLSEQPDSRVPRPLIVGTSILFIFLRTLL